MRLNSVLEPQHFCPWPTDGRSQLGERLEMNQLATYFTKTFFVTACLVLGCSGGSTLGCGGDSTQTVRSVESELLGIYQISRYQGSPMSCDDVMDIEPMPQRLVLYSFLSDGSPDQPFLGGAFCSDLDECRDVARRAPEPPIGYSFRSGDDSSGWTGFAIASAGVSADQCRADVQRHSLTTNGGNLSIETRTSESVFMPVEMEGDEITCRNGDAIAAWSADAPCKAIIVLEAEFEAQL